MTSNNSGPQWSREKRLKIARLWRNGYSAGAIGKLFGVTRNSIMGLVHRNKWRRPPPAKPMVSLMTAQTLADQPWMEVEPMPLPEGLPDLKEFQTPRRQPPRRPDPPRDGITTLELRPDTCRWPVSGTGASMLYCGQPVENAVYCPEHQARAIAPQRNVMRIRL
jgi:hypothetical protein